MMSILRSGLNSVLSRFCRVYQAGDLSVYCSGRRLLVSFNVRVTLARFSRKAHNLSQYDKRSADRYELLTWPAAASLK